MSWGLSNGVYIVQINLFPVTSLNLLYDILTNLCLIKSRLNVLHVITASLGPKLILMKNHYHTSIPHSYSFIVVKKDMQFKIAWCGMILRYDTQSQRFFLLFNLEPRHSYFVLVMQDKYHIGLKWNNHKHVVVDLNGRRKWQPSDNDYISEGTIYVCKIGLWISLTIFDTTLKLTIRIKQKTQISLRTRFRFNILRIFDLCKMT